MVVVGAGVRPDAMLAERAGLEVDDGIVCDAKLETSAPGIFAAGDVCSYDSVVHGRRLRVEHWDVALQQGRHAARGDARRPTSPTARCRTSSATSPTGRRSSTSARPTTGTRSSSAATATRGEFSAWYLKDGAVKGALSVGRSEDLVHARTLIETGADVSAARTRSPTRIRSSSRSGSSASLAMSGAVSLRLSRYRPLGIGVIGSTLASGTRSRGSSPCAGSAADFPVRRSRAFRCEKPRCPER